VDGDSNNLPRFCYCLTDRYLQRHSRAHFAGSIHAPGSAAMIKTIRVGLVGSQFVSSIHCEALRTVAAADVIAVCSATEDHAQVFAKRHGIRHWFTDFRK